MRPFLFLIVVLLAPPTWAQSRVFHDDFESGSLDQWTKDSSRPFGRVATRALDGGRAQEGERFLALNWDGADFTSVWLTHWEYRREFLIRMWWRLDEDVDDRPGAKLMRLGWGRGAPDDRMVISREYPANRSPGNNLHHVWYVQPRRRFLNCWDRTQILDDREWHRIEIYVRHDTNGRDGVIKFWFDGQMANCYPKTGNTADGSRRWYPLILPSNWSQNKGWEHDSDNHFYVDDVEIFSDVGSSAAGRLDDATIRVVGDPSPPTGSDSPAAPKNLRIVGGQ